MPYNSYGNGSAMRVSSVAWLYAFLEGSSFEDVVRTAVSLGGDSDTIACIAGGIAEGFYGVPDELKEECNERLTEGLCEILDRFYALCAKND